MPGVIIMRQEIMVETLIKNEMTCIHIEYNMNQGTMSLTLFSTTFQNNYLAQVLELFFFLHSTCHSFPDLCSYILYE